MPLGDPARLSVLQQLAGRGGADGDPSSFALTSVQQLWDRLCLPLFGPPLPEALHPPSLPLFPPSPQPTLPPPLPASLPCLSLWVPPQRICTVLYRHIPSSAWCGVEQNCMVQPAASGHSLTLITVCTVDIFEHAARCSLGCTGKGKVECSSCQPQEPFSKTCRRSGSVGRRRASLRWADRGGVGRRQCGSPLRMVGSPGMASFQSREFISTTTLASPVLSSQPESSSVHNHTRPLWTVWRHCTAFLPRHPLPTTQPSADHLVVRSPSI
jgi:hypothetical protein